MATGRCVARGVEAVVIAPYFLSRGRHIQEDIPALVRQAQIKHPGVKCVVAEPIGEVLNDCLSGPCKESVMTSDCQLLRDRPSFGPAHWKPGGERNQGCWSVIQMSVIQMPWLSSPP